MAFVLEKISEEDKKKYGFGISPDRWVVDRERNIFLIHVGGVGAPGWSKFELHFENQRIKILTKESLLDDIPVHYDAIFDIDSVLVPFDLKSRIEEIKLVICESLKKHGFFGNPEKIGNITVNFPQQKPTNGICFLDPEVMQKRDY